MLDELIPRVPEEFELYIEPFAGSAALFFELRRLRGRSFKAVINDLDADLINLYRQVRGAAERVALDAEQYSYDDETYYRVRSELAETHHPIERAAKYLYLNRTCFNGVMRRNKRGEFNVPIGRLKNPTIVNRELIFAARDAMHIRTGLADLDFEELLVVAPRGSFVYCDPPYLKQKKDSFTSYTSGPFGVEEHRRLAVTLRDADERGVRWMLSNADVPIVHELYKGFNIERVEARRSVTRVGSQRKDKVGEVIVRNYESRPVVAPNVAPGENTDHAEVRR